MKLTPSLCRAAAVAVALSTTGCLVPEQRYDQAVERIQEEQVAHRQTAERLHEAEQKLAYAEGLLNEQQDALEAHGQRLAQAKLNVDKVAVERDSAAQMVDQLRGELGRAGDHLRAFSEQKHQLESALGAAQSRAEALKLAEEELSTKILIMRDLTVALGQDVQEERAAIAALAGDPVVRLPTPRLYAGDDMKLSKEGRLMAHRIAAAVRPYGRSRLEITDISDDRRPAEALVVRLQSVADALNEAGIPFSRMTIVLPPEPSDDGEDAVAPDAAAPAAAAREETADAETASVAEGTEPDAAEADGKPEKSTEPSDGAETAETAEPAASADSASRPMGSVQITVSVVKPERG